MAGLLAGGTVALVVLAAFVRVDAPAEVRAAGAATVAPLPASCSAREIATFRAGIARNERMMRLDAELDDPLRFPATTVRWVLVFAAHAVESQRDLITFRAREIARNRRQLAACGLATDVDFCYGFTPETHSYARSNYPLDWLFAHWVREGLIRAWRERELCAERH